MDMPSTTPESTATPELAVTTPDGHSTLLLARIPASATASLLWVPALGVAARD